MNNVTIVLVIYAVVYIVDLGLLTSSATAAEIPRTQSARLLKNDYIKDNKGQFSLYYELDDGTSQYREGSLVPNDEGNGYVLVQRGSYSYISPEGFTVKMTYTADKDGFRVVEYSMPRPTMVAPNTKY